MRRRLPFRLWRPPVVAVVAALAFVNSATWALIAPNFQAPDEPSHIAYATELAETGHPPREDWNHPVTNDEANVLADGLATYDMLQFAGVTKPVWSKERERAYERAAATHPNRKNGGGPSTASVHGPVYYAFPALAYRVFYGASYTDRLFVMRLMSALFAALTVAFVFGTVRELIPTRRWAAPAAALLVAFQPMFGFIGGIVNTDNGVNLAGAALLYLFVRALRRGLSPGLAAAIPAAFILGVLAKATMLEFLPVLALGLAMLAWRRSGRLRDWALMAGVGAGLLVVWAVVAHAYHHRFIPLPAGGGEKSPYVPGPLGQLSYIWQVFFPPLPFMHHDFAPGVHPVWDIYVIRAWGSFGWLDVNLPHPVFVGIAIAMGVVAVLALRGLWLERAAVRRRAPEIVLLLVAFICVVGFTHAAFARINPGAPLLEQGRYLFPAITVPAAAAIAACFGLGRRLAPAGAVMLVTAMMLLSGFAQLVAFTTYFT